MEVHGKVTDNGHGSMVAWADLGPCQPGLYGCKLPPDLGVPKDPTILAIYSLQAAYRSSAS